MIKSWNLMQENGNEEEGLTSIEVVGISVMLLSGMGEPKTDQNVYYRAWCKLQPTVDKIIKQSLIKIDDD